MSKTMQKMCTHKNSTHNKEQNSRIHHVYYGHACRTDAKRPISDKHKPQHQSCWRWGRNPESASQAWWWSRDQTGEGGAVPSRSVPLCERSPQVCPCFRTPVHLRWWDQCQHWHGWNPHLCCVSLCPWYPSDSAPASDKIHCAEGAVQGSVYNHLREGWRRTEGAVPYWQGLGNSKIRGLT